MEITPEQITEIRERRQRGQSNRQIIKDLAISEYTIRKYAGPIYSKTSPEIIQEIQDRHRRGESINQIAKEMKIGRSTVDRYCSEMKYEFQTPKDYQLINTDTIFEKRRNEIKTFVQQEMLDIDAKFTRIPTNYQPFRR